MNKFHFNKHKWDTWKCDWFIGHIISISTSTSISFSPYFISRKRERVGNSLYVLSLFISFLLEEECLSPSISRKKRKSIPPSLVSLPWKIENGEVALYILSHTSTFLSFSFSSLYFLLNYLALSLIISSLTPPFILLDCGGSKVEVKTLWDAYKYPIFSHFHCSWTCKIKSWAKTCFFTQLIIVSHISIFWCKFVPNFCLSPLKRMKI